MNETVEEKNESCSEDITTQKETINEIVHRINLAVLESRRTVKLANFDEMLSYFELDDKFHSYLPKKVKLSNVDNANVVLPDILVTPNYTSNLETKIKQLNDLNNKIIENKRRTTKTLMSLRRYNYANNNAENLLDSMEEILDTSNEIQDLFETQENNYVVDSWNIEILNPGRNLNHPEFKIIDSSGGFSADGAKITYELDEYGSISNLEINGGWNYLDPKIICIDSGKSLEIPLISIMPPNFMDISSCNIKFNIECMDKPVEITLNYAGDGS